MPVVVPDCSLHDDPELNARIREITFGDLGDETP